MELMEGFEMEVIKEVAPGVYQLPVPMPNSPLGVLLAYLIKGEDTAALIDTGWSTKEAWQALKGFMEELEVPWDKLTRVLITHLHPDHYGLTGKIKEYSGAEILMHARDARQLNVRYQNPQELLAEIREWLSDQGVPGTELEDLTVASMPVLANVSFVKPDKLLFGGENLIAGGISLKTIWTPGHSPGHLCFYWEEEQILFSGDHVLPGISPNIGLHPQSLADPLNAYLDSLAELKELKVKLVLPGHEHAFADLNGRIDELLASHRERLDRIKEALAKEPLTAYRITAAVPWGVGDWDGMSSWNRRMALLETLAHLEYLVNKGEIAKDFQGGLEIYQSVTLR